MGGVVRWGRFSGINGGWKFGSGARLGSAYRVVGGVYETFEGFGLRVLNFGFEELGQPNCF
jgi:hypothetical protein